MLGLLSQCLSLPVSTMALKMRSGEAELHDCPNLSFSLWSRSKLLPQFTGNVKRDQKELRITLVHRHEKLDYVIMTLKMYLYQTYMHA